MLTERLFQVLRALAILSAALLITFLALPSMTKSSAWSPPRAPNFEGPYAVNADLMDATRIAEGAIGPEDVAVDAEGRVYAGTVDGKIVRTRADGTLEVFSETQGRPMGLAFGPSGDLFVTDTAKGLLRVDKDGHIEVLAYTVEGEGMLFANGIDVARDGTVYFTDSSLRWFYGNQVYDILEQEPSGRLMKWDPRTRSVTVLLRNLAFANGVALSEDERFLLVNETSRYRTLRFWLEGEKKHLAEPFFENHVGFPDNLSRTSRGTFWMGIYAPRMGLLDRLHPYPFLKDCFAALPKAWLPQPSSWGIALELDAAGRVLRTVQDPTGRHFRHVSSATEHDGVLYIGTLSGSAIGRLPLSPLEP